MNKRPPEKLPDPWLFDSESLLRELDRIREMVLLIPINGDLNAQQIATNNAIYAIWNLRDTLRFLITLHRQGQSSWAQKHQAIQHDLAERPIEGAAGMAKKREMRELQNRIFNIKDQLISLERQFAHDEAAQKATANKR